MDRPVTQIDPLPLAPVPFEGARVQRERITRTDIKAFGTTAGCPGRNVIKSRKSEHKLTPTFAVLGLRSVSKQLQKVQERLDRRSEENGTAQQDS